MNDFISSHKLLIQNTNFNNNLYHFSNNICNKHKKECYLYCKTCSVDICFFCQNFHNNHEVINYQIIAPNDKEIKFLLNSIKKYNESYNNLLIEIFKWREEIDKMIIYIKEQLKENNILNNINFIYNFNYYNMNYNSILKFRQLFSNIIDPQYIQNNNNILNYMIKEYEINDNFYKENKMGLFSYSIYSMMKFCLDKIKGRSNEISFLNNSNLIIKILSDIYFYSKNGKNNLLEKHKMYNRNSVYSRSDGNILSKKINLNMIFNKNNYKEKKSPKNFIEVLKDISNYKKIKENKNRENNFLNNSLFTSKVGNIFLEQNKLHLELSSKSFCNEDINNKIFNKKPISKTPLNIHNTISTNSISLGRNTNSNIYYKKSYSHNKIMKNINISDSYEFNIHNKNNFNKTKIDKEKIISKYYPKKKVHNKIYINKNNQGKTYIHKKFDNLNIKQKNIVNSGKKITYSPKMTNSEIKAGKNKIYDDDEDFTNINISKILNNTFTPSDTLKKKINFEACNAINNILPSLKKDCSLETYYKINNIKPKTNTIKFNEISTTNNENNNTFKIIKNSYNKKYIIDANKPLFLGLELSNNNCKLCLLNENEKKNNKSIELFCFKENCYLIPTLLSFNENKGDIEIGYQALDNLLSNPSRTIFNIMKIFGKSYNEISLNKNLYPYKILYNDSFSNRPFIQLNFENKKDKNYYFEDIFTIYMEKLFEMFFDEVELEFKDKKNNKNIIQIILVIGIPDNYNYFQRKIIEKLFQTHIFPKITDISNSFLDYKQEHLTLPSSKSSTSLSMHSSKNKYKKKLYGGYQIALRQIKIENSTSIVNLCFKPNFETIRNILLININGDSTNISLASIYQEKDSENDKRKYLYEIKKENLITIGEGDLIDNFIEQKLKIKNEHNIEAKDNLNINHICSLRKLCNEIIQKINKNNIEYTLEENNIKKEFLKSLNDIYSKIILSIKKMIRHETINENNINAIVLIGSLSRTTTFIQMLKKLFKYNKDITKQLINLESMNDLPFYNDEIYEDYYIAAGAAIQSYNIGTLVNKYILLDICPISFGIESLDGLMDFVIEKGDKIPKLNQKFIKIKRNNANCKNENFLEINIYEGENKEVNKNKLISCVNIDKKNFNNEKITNNYIEILIQFEIDKYFNLKVFVLEPKTLKRRFECLINIDIIRG